MSGCIIIITVCISSTCIWGRNFEKWKESVACRPGFEDAKKNRMLLSQATRDPDHRYWINVCEVNSWNICSEIILGVCPNYSEGTPGVNFF